MVNFKLKKVVELFKRRYKLMNIGLEFRVSSTMKTMYIAFVNTEERDLFYNAMKELVADSCVTADQSILDYT